MICKKPWPLKTSFFFYLLSSGKFTKVMKQKLAWIHVPVYEIPFAFLFTEVVLLLLMPSPTVQIWFSKTTFQEEVITEKVIHFLVCRQGYFVFSFFCHLITMVGSGEKEIIYTRGDIFLSSVGPLPVTLHWWQSWSWNDQENNCLQWKTTCFGWSNRGEVCPVSESYLWYPRFAECTLGLKTQKLLM